MSLVIQGRSYANQGIICMARIAGENGAMPPVSAWASATYRITDITTYPVTEVVDTTSLSPLSSYLYSEPQNDSCWTADDVGYNFKLEISDSVLTSSGHCYMVEVWLEPGIGPMVPLVFKVVTQLSYGP